jgi:hypothetical protein
VSASRVISYLPPGELHVSWTDRRQREGLVVFVPEFAAGPRLRAYNDAYFKRAISEWRRLGIALDLEVYAEDNG